MKTLGMRLIEASNQQKWSDIIKEQKRYLESFKGNKDITAAVIAIYTVQFGNKDLESKMNLALVGDTVMSSLNNVIGQLVNVNLPEVRALLASINALQREIKNCEYLEDKNGNLLSALSNIQILNVRLNGYDLQNATVELLNMGTIGVNFVVIPDDIPQVSRALDKWQRELGYTSRVDNSGMAYIRFKIA